MSCSALFGIKRAIENFRAEIKAETVFTLGTWSSWYFTIILSMFQLLDGPATVEATQLDCLVDPSEFYF